MFVLLKLITETSFIKIGKMFGVADNTIRNWCDSYGIPKNEAIDYIKENNITLDDISIPYI